MPGRRRIPRGIVAGGGQTAQIASSGTAAITTYSSGGSNYRVYLFKSSSSLTITKGLVAADYLVVGGGGGGGAGQRFNYTYNGNGGAGGVVLTGSATLQSGTYTITVGSGGAGGGKFTPTSGGGGTNGSGATAGQSSTLSGNGLSLTAAGGIAGSVGTGDISDFLGGRSFVSRGAGTSTLSFVFENFTYQLRNGGGGLGNNGNGYTGGMVSGATSTAWASGYTYGNGGLGTESNITGTTVMYGSGGGGGGTNTGPEPGSGYGWASYGVGFSPVANENVSNANSRHGTEPWQGCGAYIGLPSTSTAPGYYYPNGRANTGGGGGGASVYTPGVTAYQSWMPGGSGGSGVVVIRVRL